MTDPQLPTSILSDLPTDEDHLDFGPYVDTLVDLVRGPRTGTPLTIGLFGTWGSGKTSLMRMVRKKLLVKDGFRTAWFDAWKYDKEEVLWRALLLQVLLAVRSAVSAADADTLAELDELQDTLYRALDKEEIGSLQFDWGQAASGLAQGALQIGLSYLPVIGQLTKLIEELQKEGGTTATEKLAAAFRRERTKIHVAQVQFLDQFQARFAELVREHIVAKKHRLVVFIDDLDRCSPEKAVEVLEAIKLFLDVPGCVFILGLDQEVIARGIELKYRELGLLRKDDEEGEQRFLIQGNHYLEKIIQLPFHIPPIESDEMAGFVRGLVAEWPDKMCADVFAAGLGDNPRQVKRTVNVFLLLWGLVAKRPKLQGRIKPIRLAKVVVIQNTYPELYNLLKATPRLLRDLENYYRQESALREKPDVETEISPTRTRGELPPALARFTGRPAIQSILTLHRVEVPDANFGDLTPTELRSYFTLAGQADAPKVVEKDAPRSTYEPEMILIPAGEFQMGDGNALHRLSLPEYSIGKYPVTNTEYRAFVEAAGHGAPDDWEYGHPPPDKSDHPVVNVSWHDAVAYCRWLAESTGKPYTLPSEAEWEKAARGDQDARLYPWGNNFDKTRCNTKEAGIGNTTPVGQFSPQGDSPYNCVDMSGNVWEWTRSMWARDYQKPGYDYPYDAHDGREDLVVDEPRVARVLRGGSFYNYQVSARVSFRLWNLPDYWFGDVGFRVALPSRPQGA